MKRYGQVALSVASGGMVQELVSDCLVSKEKLPKVVTAVIQMLFGHIPKQYSDQFVFAPSTYELARVRYSEVADVMSKELFTKRDNPQAVVHACLCMDKSNKRKAINLKLLSHSSVDKVTRLRTCNADVVLSEVAAAVAVQTQNALKKELTDSGMIRFLAATGDNHGLAPLKIFNIKMDAFRNVLPDIMKDSLKVEAYGGSLYDYCEGYFATGRHWSCSMHSTERIIEPLLRAFIGPQGLKNTATVAQNLYSISHYMQENIEVIEYFNLLSVGNNPDRLNELPDPIRKKFKKICSSRWISPETACDEVIKLSDVEATQPMINICREYFADEWDTIVPLCSCFSDDTKLSYLAMMFLYLANHVKGGTAGEQYQKLMDIVAFLGASSHRCCVKIVAGILPFHKNLAAFYDSASAIDDRVQTISTRLIEIIPHDRKFMEFIAALDHDWASILPDAKEFIQKEKRRAIRLGKEEGIMDRVEAKIEVMMKDATTEMMARAKKYLYEYTNTSAWSLLHLVDPTLAPYCILALDKAYVNAMLDGETTLPVDVEVELKKIANKRIWTIVNIVGYLKQKDEEQYGHLTTGISADAAKVLLINYFKDNNISWENAAKESYIPNNGLEQA